MFSFLFLAYSSFEARKFCYIETLLQYVKIQIMQENFKTPSASLNC